MISLRRFFRLSVIAAFLAIPACKAPTIADDPGMDESVVPGDDFFAYANGGWFKTTAIPPDKSSFGVFAMMADDTRRKTVALIQDAAKDTGGNEDMRKIGDFYSSFMDEAAIESKGVAPLQEQFDEIARIGDKRALSRVIGSRLRADVDPLNSTNFQTDNLIGVWIAQGLTDPSHNTPYLLQGGLGLPDRDDYVSDDPHMAGLRTQYRTHIEAMLKLAGVSEPAARAARIFGLETKMAKTHATRVESADVHNAGPWKREELATKAPGLDWPALLEAASLKDSPAFIIWHPKALAGLSALAASEPIDVWKDWLTLHTIEQAAGFLPKAFVDESFMFYGKALNGTPQLRERWQRGTDYTSGALGELVGKIYVARHFPAETKTKVKAMTDDLLKAFANRIDSLTWMSPETKARAKAKVAAMRIGVGYPDRWKDYSALEIVKGDALGNIRRAELFYYRQQLAKLRQPVDRDEWWMTPQTVNAVNLPLQNALNFPAAILQPPFFDANMDAAHNYGSMGAIIGHEISHSFDDQGSQFDADGRIANWWTTEDLDHFKSAGAALAVQYDKYRPFPDLAVHGRQTLSENIADLAGLAAAYDAFHLSLQGRSAGDRQFFISYAQSWRQKIREAALRNQITSDGHAPDEYRAATVRNLDAWYTAFDVKPGQKMYLDPKDRVRVW